MTRRNRSAGPLARLLLTITIAVGVAPAAWAQSAAPAVIELWPEGQWPDNPVSGPEQVGREGSALGAARNIATPRMEVYRPKQPNGAAVLILGGGGYFRVQIGTAARPIAQWLQALGVTPVVLFYRLPGDGWKAEAPFQDAQRAMRLLRARAGEFGIDPGRIGIIGLSAGANLGGIMATRFDHDFYPAVDAADTQSSRPDFLGMIYPVVSLRPPLDSTRSRRELSTQPDAVDAYSVEAHVRADMPPVFLAHAADDPIADVGHSLVMFEAARAQSVAAELHVFDHGGHSWGLGRPGTQVAAWPRLFATWARRHGVMDPAAAAAPAGDIDED